MVNPIKFIGRATGLSKIFEKPDDFGPGPQAAAPQQAAPTEAAPPPAPFVGQSPSPSRPARKPRTFAPAIIGSGNVSGGGGSGESNSGGKTLLGQ